MPSGIYKIINIVNNEIYIGSSSHSIQMRWRRHKSDLNRNIHPNKHLQASWNKYGKESFNFEIIETCEPLKCIEREQYYIDTLNPKFNKERIAGSSLGRKASLETRLKMSKSQKGISKNKGIKWGNNIRTKRCKAIITINPSNNEKKEYYSISEAARFYKGDRKSIGNAIKNNRLYKELYWELKTCQA